MKLHIAKEKTIAVISVSKAIHSFHSIDNHVLIHLEKGNKMLIPYEIIKFSYAKGFQQADRELVEVDFDLLKTEYYEKWRKNRNIDSNNIKEVLFHTGLARKDEKGVLKPTRAAVLLFALYPNEFGYKMYD